MPNRLMTLLAGLTLAVSAPVLAQNTEDEAPPSPAFPEFDIFLFDYDAAKDEGALSGGANATDRTGYDNQPFFTANSDTFLYSRDDGKQTDIWEYEIASGTHTRLTQTPESEFSPTPSPDNQTISFVFERSNSIWQIDRAALDEPKWALETTGIKEPVGYFARNYESGDILYWSRFGFSVALTNAQTPAYHFISGHAVPSTPHIIPGSQEISFVHRQTNEQVWIKAFDPKTKAIRPLAPIVGENANYTWAPDGAILQIEDNILHRWREGETRWTPIADLSQFGVTSAARIAVSPDSKRVAIVGVPAD